MRKLLIGVLLVGMLSGCAGFICFDNTKGVDAKAKASKIKTSKGNIEDAKGSIDYGSTLKSCIYWPWKTESMPTDVE